MALLLAPYTNAMRLGQGFNSYTQQICVDDAVVIDPARAEVVLTNDGTTMRILAASAGKPSAWNRLTEVVNEGPLASSNPASVKERASSPTDKLAIEDAPLAGEKGSTTNSDKAVLPTGDKSDAPKDDTGSDSSDSPPAPTELKGIKKKKEDGEDAAEDAAGDDSANAGQESKIQDDKKPDVKDDRKGTESSTRDSSDDGDTAVKIVKEDVEADMATGGDSSTEGNKPTPDPESKVSPAATTTSKAATADVASLDKSVEVTKPTSVKPRPKVDSDVKPRVRSSSTGNKSDVHLNDIPGRTVQEKSLTKETPAQPSKEAVAKETRPGVTEKAPSKSMTEFELEQARLDREEKLEMMKAEKERMAEIRSHQRKLELEAREEEMKRQAEDREEQRQLRKEKREYDAARRAAAQKSIADAVAANKEPLTLEQLDKIRAQNQFADRFTGMDSSDQTYTFDASGAPGASQTVTYSSRFVDSLTDVTDDMMVSGALTVKMAKIGGSGKGSFVNSDKFKQSDLNFYISVKVTNQTSNFKDVLVYNPMRSVAIGSKEHNKVYGDTFISGFQEGGEFNAIISMKIHNKAKLLDIKAEASVALTAGPVDITAQANVGIARTNLEVNTETTIQVSWSGGGHIKPMEQPWDIKSVMQAASRFPQLVADCPQRTYAILTKYDSLRSFVSLRPAVYSPIQYENAQIYTNVLMEAFLSYKALYKQLGDQISSIQGKTLEFVPWSESSDTSVSNSSSKAVVTSTSVPKPGAMVATSKTAAALEAANDTTRFEASVAGLSLARKFIRRQMVYIVNEVDLIEGDPKVATDEDHEEPFQSPTLLESRLPATRIPEALQLKSDPLSGKRIMAKTQTEADLEKEREAQDELERDNPSLFQENQDLSSEEKNSLTKIQERIPSIGRHLQVSNAAPKTDKGELFNNLEFLSPEWQVECITIGMTKRGCVGSVEVVYENGLILRKGLPPAGLTLKTLRNFQQGERITSAMVEVGTEASGSLKEPRVLSICMYTNRGRRLLGQATKNEFTGQKGHVKKDNVEYREVNTLYIDSAYSTGTFKGFFGRVSLEEATGGILRLGFIWGDSVTSKLSTTIASAAPVYEMDAAASEAAIDAMRAEEKRLADAAVTQVRNEMINAAASREKDWITRMAQTADEARQIKLRGVSTGRQSVSFKGDTFRVKPSRDPFLVFENGTLFKYQPNSDFFVVSGSGQVLWTIGRSGPESEAGDLIFHGSNDGNLVAWLNTPRARWETDTKNCRNGTLVLSSESPYIEIFNAEGVRRWHQPS